MITPVLLCGGSGTRLWPVSRQSFPKQFAEFIGNGSLFQAAARRAAGQGFAAPLVVTGDPFRFIVKDQLAAVAIKPSAVLIEPESRNTAPAVLAAALWQAERDPDALMIVLPTDHLLPDSTSFAQTVMTARAAAEDGRIVTFGITPTRPETGYGYLELTDSRDQVSPGLQPLARFIEKPNSETAAELVSSGRCLWNSGIFLFSAKAMLQAFETHAPEMRRHAEASYRKAQMDLGFTRLAAKPWSLLSEISIDHAIMEKENTLSVMPYGGAWSDLGGWEAVWQESGRDAHGNAVSAHALAIGCRNTLLRSEHDGLELVGIGLSDIVAVATPDAVVVARTSEAQRVKDAVKALKAKGADQATSYGREQRPWGWFECLARGSSFQVKRIVVNPGAALSLQSHQQRAEHWVVVEGTAQATIGDRAQKILENQSVFIPQGERHRLANTAQRPLVVIEVQTGPYLGEDDIIRYEDAYGRR